MSRRILVTSALPYANGSIHIGHLVEYIYTDIWVRHLRMDGADAIYMCADDTHGTPIEIRARKEKIRPESLIERMHEEHFRDFSAFEIFFDRFYTTHSDENRKWAERIYRAARQNEHIEKRTVEQTYCEKDGMFLPDRYVRGTCPKCGSPDQYGDSCDSCSATYAPVDLKDPRCSICGTSPVRRSSDHQFFTLSSFNEKLTDWTSCRGNLQEETRNYVGRWLKDGLRDWDISRDGPYFGFEIPDEENMYFYVWFDAPIGYIATTDKYCQEKGLNVSDWWENPDTEIVHFIGKDIVYFHTLFWPAMLMDAGLTLPRRVHVHGFLRVEGSKMSKSRGTFITARTYLENLHPQYLRYYYASKLSGKVEDIDLSFDDFLNRVNAELVNKIANLASRSISFVNKRMDSRLGSNSPDSGQLLDRATDIAAEAKNAYENFTVAKAVSLACGLAEDANVYMQEKAPWDVLKTDPEKTRSILTTAINISKVVSVILKPVLPEMTEKMEKMLGAKNPWTWSDAKPDLCDVQIGSFVRLAERVEKKNIEAMIKSSMEEETEDAGSTASFKPAPLEEEITIDDFSKCDLRVARVISAQKVEGAKKLLSLELDLGPLGKRRVFAGIAQHYPDPGDLVSKQLVCVVNLKPRKMKWGTSGGMVLASSGAGSVTLLEVGPSARPGEKVS